MNIKKIIFTAIVITAFNVFIEKLTYAGAFNWVYQIEPTYIWKPAKYYTQQVMIISELIFALIFVFVYTLIKKGIPGKNKFMKGLSYGLIFWLVELIPGMISTYLHMAVAIEVIVCMTIINLIALPLTGLIVVTIYGE